MNTEELRQRLTLIIAETPVNQCWTLSTVHLLKLVEDVQKAEREACAEWLRDNYQDYNNIADTCEAIRARVIDAAIVAEVGIWGER